MLSAIKKNEAMKEGERVIIEGYEPFRVARKVLFECMTFIEMWSEGDRATRYIRRVFQLQGIYAQGTCCANTPWLLRLATWYNIKH